LKLKDCVASLHLSSIFSPIRIEAGKYIEHGEFRGNLYGTAIESVADLVAAGYQPILTPHFQVGD
jgi:guanylate kinase